MKLLAIDTSSSRCSVALAVDGAVIEDTRKVEREHNKVLLPMIDRLCETGGCRPPEIDGVTFNAGPGSFTGVRLAATAAQAIAFAGDAQVLPVASSELLAAHAFEAGEARVVTSIKSRAELFYLAQYDRARGVVAEDTLCDSIPDWLDRDCTLVGMVPPWLEGMTALPDDPAPASALIKLAQQRWPDRFLAPEMALPIYVQGDHPWKRQSG